ncbi:g10800 [Coccomyxa elongata]
MALAKTAVVVGIGPGAGAGIARRFAREGYKVALISRRQESIAPVEKGLRASGAETLAVPCDTGKPEDVVAAHARVCEALGAPEVLVYNAGPGGFTWPPPAALDISPEAFSRGFDSGVTGALVWAQQVLPAMLKAGRGTIIFTGATASVRGSAKFAMLACPKFALRALAQSLAREFQPQGIHVAHAIIDGIIDAPRLRSMMPHRDPETFLSPDAIADAYWHLHSQHRSAWTHEIDLRPASETF